jgi:hypothetical protein
MNTLVIAPRFCGPPDCGNGGYTAGRLAGLLSGPVEVTLRAPAPLATELVQELRAASDAGAPDVRTERAVLRTHDGTLIAEAAPVAFQLQLPVPPSFDAARHASEAFIGFQEHPYPGCFVCGHQRSASQGAGLSLFPGAVVQSVYAPPVVAAPFVPAGDLGDDAGLLRPEFVWAALDCPSWFGHAAFAPSKRTILLGRIAVHIERRPALRERCVVMGWGLGQEGRRIQCASALFDADGACLAYARSTWIELKES